MCVTTVNHNGASSSQQGTLMERTRRSIVDLRDPSTLPNNVNQYLLRKNVLYVEM